MSEEKKEEEVKKEEKEEEVKKEEDKKEEDKKEEDKKDFVNVTDDGGVKKRIIKEGSGEQAAEGNEVKVNYIGKNGDKIFDQTKDKPFSFKIGAHSGKNNESRRKS